MLSKQLNTQVESRREVWTGDCSFVSMRIQMVVIAMEMEIITQERLVKRKHLRKR